MVLTPQQLNWIYDNIVSPYDLFNTPERLVDDRFVYQQMLSQSLASDSSYYPLQQAYHYPEHIPVPGLVDRGIEGCLAIRDCILSALERRKRKVQAEPQIQGEPQRRIQGAFVAGERQPLRH